MSVVKVIPVPIGAPIVKVVAGVPGSAIGPQGPQGPQGPAGSTGPQGEQGIAGENALWNYRGAWSSSEVPYYVGDVAYNNGTTWYAMFNTNEEPGTGEDWNIVSLKGDAGETGATGATGLKGDKGDTGNTGPQGIQGIQGVKGDKGDTGDQGIQGIQGDKGDKGDAGDQGPQGIQGIQGIQGDAGLAGDAATITVGTVSSVAYGSAATVINVGTSSAAVFDFEIPEGQPGSTGAAEYVSVVKHLAKNVNGSTLNIGTPVYVATNGSSSTNIEVKAASNLTEAASSKTIGLIAGNTLNNGFEYVITEGLLAGLDTSTSSAGDPVWLGVNGALIYGTNNKPIAPAHLVFIGVVTRSNQNNGEIFVKPQNGFELNEIHNVLIGTDYSSIPADNDLLAYDTASSLWKNQTAAQAGFATVATSGSYTDLTNKPTIPTVNNATVTIAAGTGLSGGGSFTVDQSSPSTITLNSTITQYSLPTATASVLGGIKIGSGLTIDGSGVLSADVTANGSPTFVDVTTTGYLKTQQTEEAFNAYSTSISSGATVALNCSTGNIFYITSTVSGNWTANFTNLNLDSGYVTNTTLIIQQGATGYIPTAVQIGGAAQTINWQGGSAPTPNANKKDVIAISILNSSGTYTVFGQLVTFG